MEDSGIDSSDKDIKQKYLDGDSENSSNDAAEVTYRGSISTTDLTCSLDKNGQPHMDSTSSCRALQKKLEIKVERAKRNYQKLLQNDTGDDWDVCITQPKTNKLMPISRLQYPGKPEKHTLIEYSELNTENLDDDLGLEEARFFASKHKKLIKQDLSDTFSVQEMTIESDSDSGSDRLELQPPTDAQYWDRLAAIFPCCGGLTDI